jgi:eukaryotic-like serine/threonine-protein kinase
VSDGFAQGLVGVTLDGRYRLDAVLGEGGMGSVFRATQLAMDRKVAVKLLKPHLTGDAVATERFNREARATLKVDSPHAVKVLDFGITPLGDYYMVLEYLDGRTVQRELEIDGVFAPARVAHIARQALHALGIAHAQGLIHRDVKPDNLLLMRNGADGDYTKILDFGVAKLMQGAGDPGQLALTAAGMVFGTPEFMSPEQACGQPLDGRSDLYSLAATMFVMLTGTTLFEGNTAIEWLTHHVRTPAPALAMARPELAAYPELDAVMQRCLAKARDARPATAAEMAHLLAELAPTLARSPGGESPRTPSKPTQVHSSSYFRPLDQAALSGATESMPAVPSVADADRRLASQPGTVDSAASTAVPISPPRRNRLRFWLAGIAVASLIGIAIGVSLQQSGAPSADSRTPHAESRTPSAESRTPPADSRTPHAESRTPSAESRTPSADSRTPSADSRTPSADSRTPPAVAAQPVAVALAGPAAGAPRPRGAKPPAASRAAPPSAGHNPEADEHLRAAEDAARDGNQLRQQGEADAALRADPTNPRAKYLLGDALIKGDTFKADNFMKGCSYLAELRHMRAARERARAAGCRGN